MSRTGGRRRAHVKICPMRIAIAQLNQMVGDLSGNAERILAAVDAKVDTTLVELAEMLRQDHGVTVAPSTVWRLLDRHDMTVKKRPPTPPSN